MVAWCVLSEDDNDMPKHVGVTWR